MKKVIMIVCALVLAAGTQVFSETEDAQYKLGEIIVSGEGSVVESVGTVHRVTALEIKERGVRTLDEALKLIPGIYIRYGASGAPRIDIRGLRTRHVSLLLNGIPIKDTYDGQFDPSTIPVDHIAEIKVTTGGASVLYGSGGSAGVINIITRKGTPGLKGSLMGEAGPEGYYSGNAVISGAKDRVDGILSVGRTIRDAFVLPDDFEPTSSEDGDERENSDLERVNVFTNLNYKASDVFDLGLTVNYHSGEDGTPPSAINDKKDIFASTPKYDRVDDFEGAAVQLAFDYDFEGPLELRGWGYFDQTDMTTSRYDDDTYTTIKKNGAYTEDSTSRIQGLNCQLKYSPAKGQQFALAAMVESDGWDADGFEINKSGAKVFQSTDKSLTFYSVAAEYSVALTDSINAVAGVGEHFMQKDSGSDENDFTCMIGADYSLSRATRFKGSFARTVNFPSVKQLYEISGGNPDLNAEVNYNYELGMEQVLPGSTVLSVTGYVKNAKDFIEKDENDQSRNFEEYQFTGVDIELVNTWFSNLTLAGTYSYMDSEDKSTGTEKDELQYRPGQKLTLQGTYRFPFGMTVYLSVMHVADQYFYSKNSPFEKKKVDDFQVVDFKVSQKFLKDRLEVYIRGENLLDELYSQSYGYPCAGRSIYGGARYSF
ncbi:MAG: TonB-dependent receptor [Pseudomonadota bacterium]